MFMIIYSDSKHILCFMQIANQDEQLKIALIFLTGFRRVCGQAGDLSGIIEGRKNRGDKFRGTKKAST